MMSVLLGGQSCKVVLHALSARPSACSQPAGLPHTPMASNFSATDSTPDVTSSERVMWVLIWYLGILPALWLLPVVVSWLRRPRGKTEAVAPSASTISSSEAAMLEAAEHGPDRVELRTAPKLLKGPLAPPDLSRNFARQAEHWDIE